MASALLAIAIAIAPASTDALATNGAVARSQPRLRRAPPPALTSEAVPTPALLKDILKGDRRWQATTTPPNALNVFRKVLSYVWSGTLGARLMEAAAACYSPAAAAAARPQEEAGVPRLERFPAEDGSLAGPAAARSARTARGGGQ